MDGNTPYCGSLQLSMHFGKVMWELTDPVELPCANGQSEWSDMKHVLNRLWPLTVGRPDGQRRPDIACAQCTSARSWSAARAHTVTDHKQISTTRRLKQKHTYVISRLSLDTCFRRLKKARETEVPIILISLRHRVETDGRVSICGARTMQCVPVCPLRTRCGGAATKKGSLLVQLPLRIATR